MDVQNIRSPVAYCHDSRAWRASSVCVPSPGAIADSRCPRWNSKQLLSDSRHPPRWPAAKRVNTTWRFPADADPQAGPGQPQIAGRGHRLGVRTHRKAMVHGRPGQLAIGVEHDAQSVAGGAFPSAMYAITFAASFWLSLCRPALESAPNSRLSTGPVLGSKVVELDSDSAEHLELARIGSEACGDVVQIGRRVPRKDSTPSTDCMAALAMRRSLRERCGRQLSRRKAGDGHTLSRPVAPRISAHRASDSSELRGCAALQ